MRTLKRLRRIALNDAYVSGESGALNGDNEGVVMIRLLKLYFGLSLLRDFGL